MLLSTLKNKILGLLISSVGGSMLLAGLTLGYFINQQHEKDAQQIFNAFYKDASTSLMNLEKKLSQDAAALAANPGIISSLNLVSEYASIDNYQALIFDKEKWDIVNHLSNYARAAQISHIRIHDKNGYLVSFVDNEPQHLEEGILSFKDKQPKFKILSIEHNSPSDTPKHNHWLQLTKVTLANETAFTRYSKDINNGVYLQTSYPIYRTLPDKTKIYLGKIFIGRQINLNFLSAFSQHRSLSHQLYTDVESALKFYEKDISPNLLSGSPEFNRSHSGQNNWLTSQHAYINAKQIKLANNTHLFIISKLDRSLVKQQITTTAILVTIVFLISTVIIISIGIIFSRASITQPMDQLLSQARRISSGDYDIETVRTGTTELDTIANTLHQAAATIHNREDQLRAANIDMELRVQQRTTDLSNTNEELANEITARKIIEDHLRQSREMLRTIMDNIPQYIFWKDTEYKYLGFNKNFLELAGLSDEADIIGKTDYDLPWKKEESDFYRSCDQRVIRNDSPEFHIQETVTDNNDNIVYVDTNKIPLHNLTGKVIGILGTFEDISIRKIMSLNYCRQRRLQRLPTLQNLIFFPV